MLKLAYCDTKVILEMTEEQYSVYINEIMETPILKKLDKGLPQTLLEVLTEFEVNSNIEATFSSEGLTDEQLNSIAMTLGMNLKTLKSQAKSSLEKMAAGQDVSMNKLLGVIPPQIADQLWGGKHSSPIFVGTLNNLNSPLDKVIGSNDDSQKFDQFFTMSTTDGSKLATLNDFLVQLQSRADSDEARMLRRKKEWAKGVKSLLEELRGNPAYIQLLLTQINKKDNDSRIDNLKVNEVVNSKIDFRDFSQVKNPECDFTATLTADYIYELVDEPAGAPQAVEQQVAGLPQIVQPGLARQKV